MRIILVRHGQSEDNITRTIAGHRPTPLSELGREQAISLGQKFLEMGTEFDAVYSSDLRRASETASIICDEIGFEDIIFDRRLREGNAGIFTGRCVHDLTEEERELFDSLIVDLDSRASGGESANEQFIRTRNAFLEIVEKHPEDTTILLVGHGGTLYHILKRTLDVLPDTDEWFGNCRLNILERISRSSPWNLTVFNNRELQ